MTPTTHTPTTPAPRATVRRAIRNRASVRAGRGKKCGCVAPSSFEEARLTAPVPYL